MTPPETVMAAMPGTLGELVERTGFPPATVLKLITIARKDGERITAVREKSEDRPGAGRIRLEEDFTSATIFIVDNSSQPEVS